MSLEIEKAIHDYLCDTVTYQANNTISFEDNDTAIGALLNGCADCDGYADAFFLICSMAGLETRRVVGTLSLNNIKGYHAWNAIKINGKWCFIDVAIDDQPLLKTVYAFYNRGKDDISATHTWISEILDIDVVARTDKSFCSAELIDIWEDFTVEDIIKLPTYSY